MPETKSNRKYLKDEYATKILVDEDCREYLLAIIDKVIGDDIGTSVVHLKDIRINSKIAFKDSETDAIFENNGSIINVEINYAYSKNMDYKNMTYVCQLILGQTKSGKDFKYSDIKPCYQINICGYDYFNRKEFIYKSTLRDEKNNILRTKLMTVYDINLEYLQNLGYTNIVKKYGKDSLESYLYLFLCTNREEVAKISEGSKIMKLVKDKIFSLEVDDLGWTREDVINAQLEDQIFAEGVKQGIEQGKKETALAMLKQKISLEKIAKCTRISIEELKKLNEEINN